MSFKDKIFKNQSPWGSPPGDGGRPSDGNGSGTRQDPPNLDDIIKNIQKTISKFSGGKSGGSRPIVIGLLISSSDSRTRILGFVIETLCSDSILREF